MYDVGVGSDGLGPPPTIHSIFDHDFHFIRSMDSGSVAVPIAFALLGH
jgi:hypothetical protein